MMALILMDFGTMLSIVFFLSLISGTLLARLPGKSSGTLLAPLPGKSSELLSVPPSPFFSETDKKSGIENAIAGNSKVIVVLLCLCALLLVVAVLLCFVLWKCYYHCRKARPPTRTDQDSNPGSWDTDNKARLPTRTDQDSNPGSWVTDSRARLPTRTDQDSNPGSWVTDSKARLPTRTDQDSNPGSWVTWVTYRVTDMIEATKNFSESNLVGEGGFGRVYRADLVGNTIGAVKRLRNVDPTLFDHELSILLRMPRHPNLVNLIGLCSDPDDQMIVFEYVANGTLFSRLHENQGVERPPLSWAARKEIARQVAEALIHLHEKANPPIIHRDVKSKNVLLETDLCAKLADFGIAKLGPKNNRSTGTTPRGTFGYMDPQCVSEYNCSVKSDVYSFGVLLLELITGTEALIGSKALVISTRTDRLSTDTNNIMRIVHQSLTDCNNRNELLEMIEIANRCLQSERGDRPSMAEVVNMMKGIGNANAL